VCTDAIYDQLFWSVIWEQSSVWISSLLFPCGVCCSHAYCGNQVMHTLSYPFLPQKARSLNIHQLLAEESEDKLEEYYRQKYATTSSARLETIVCDVLLCGGVGGLGTVLCDS